MAANEWVIEVARMSWGQWRASAIQLGSLDRAIDGPYRDTKEAAIVALIETHEGVSKASRVFG